MSFLERLEDDARLKLMSASDLQYLEPGDYLLRRGEQGGDVYLVEQGTFDVVDTRSVPEVIIQVVGKGALLGDMAFLDGAVRAADLRCTARSQVRVWTKTRLEQALREDLALERSFYRALASVTTERLRGMVNMSTTESRGRLGQNLSVEKEAQTVSSEVLSVWSDLDARLRNTPGDPESRAAVGRAVEKLQERARYWLGGIQDTTERYEAGEALCRTLQPFLQQAHLSEFALAVSGDDPGRRVPRAHIIHGQAAGHGELGVMLDSVLLGLPTSQAIRRIFRVLTQEVESAVPADDSAKVTLLGVGCGALVSDLSIRLARRGACIHLVDGDRDVLDSFDMGMSVRPRKMQLKLVRCELGLLSMGRGSLSLGAQDVVVVGDLASHLPDRFLAALFAQVRDLVGTDGTLLVAGLAPSRDSVVFDHLMRWPMIRRTRRQLLGLMEAAGYRAEVVDDESEDADCALIIRARGA